MSSFISELSTSVSSYIPNFNNYPEEEAVLTTPNSSPISYQTIIPQCQDFEMINQSNSEIETKLTLNIEKETQTEFTLEEYNYPVSPCSSSTPSLISQDLKKSEILDEEFNYGNFIYFTSISDIAIIQNFFNTYYDITNNLFAYISNNPNKLSQIINSPELSIHNKLKNIDELLNDYTDTRIHNVIKKYVYPEDNILEYHIMNIQLWLKLEFPVSNTRRAKIFSYLNNQICEANNIIAFNIRKLVQLDKKASYIPCHDLDTLMQSTPRFIELSQQFYEVIAKTTCKTKNINSIKTVNVKELYNHIQLVIDEIEDYERFKFGLILKISYKSDLESLVNSIMGDIKVLYELDHLTLNRIHILKLNAINTHRAMARSCISEEKQYINDIYDVIRMVTLE